MTQDTGALIEPVQPLPLAGVVVVELGDSAAAPYAAFILASLGATVWKIERPLVGDTSRSWGSELWKGSGPIYHALNRGKKSVVLDIKRADDLDALKRFVASQADVFIHNLRPGTSPRYGLDEQSLRALNPALVHCSVGAFGATGPMNQLPGFDPLLQAFSGIMSVTGEAGHSPVRAGVSLVDFGTGMWAAMGVITALLARRDTGAGRAVDISLFETALGFMTAAISTYQVTQQRPAPMGSGIGFVAPYKAYLAADGHLVVACGNDRLFEKLCGVLERPEWIADPRFSTNAQRVQHRAVLDGLIEDLVGRRTRSEWRTLFGEAGVPCAPIQYTDEVVTHPQTEALDILRPAPDDELRLVGLPINFDGSRPCVDHGAPPLGADNAEFDRLVGRGLSCSVGTVNA